MFLENAAPAPTPEVGESLTPFEKIFSFDWGLPGPLQTFINKCIEVFVVIFVLIILCRVVDFITKKVKSRMQKKNVDKTVTQVVYYLSNKIVKVLLVFMAVGFLGIDTSSLVGLVTAAGLGVSLAVQGSLSNFAGGLLILVLRPFRVDDFIECQGVSGTVEQIKIFHTYLTTPDNKVVLIPNGQLIGGNIVNYSTKPTRRVDLTFTIDYEEDFRKSENLILDICKKHPLILETPETTVRISNLGASSVDLTVKAWVKGENYWPVTFDLLETVYDEMNKEGIKIPYNQLEISYRDALNKQNNELGTNKN